MKLSLVSVEVRNGDINKAIKVFKQKVIQSGHIEELKERKEYIQPSIKRRLEIEEAIRKNRRKVKREKLLNGVIKKPSKS